MGVLQLSILTNLEKQVFILQSLDSGISCVEKGPTTFSGSSGLTPTNGKLFISFLFKSSEKLVARLTGPWSISHLYSIHFPMALYRSWSEWKETAETFQLIFVVVYWPDFRSASTVYPISSRVGTQGLASDVKRKKKLTAVFVLYLNSPPLYYTWTLGFLLKALSSNLEEYKKNVRVWALKGMMKLAWAERGDAPYKKKSEDSSLAYRMYF